MVSAALIREEDKIQRLVYYVSQAFQGVEAQYPRMEKITFALIVASRKLCPYFQAYPIIMMIDQPIKKVINKLEAAGQMIQWAIELGQFNIEYRPRTAIKAQVLADFIAEFTSLEQKDNQGELWTIHTDGSSTQKRGGASVVIASPDGVILKFGVQINFPVTKNKAEYEAILTELRIAHALRAKNALIRSDSQLVIGQVKGDFKVKETRMQRYLKLMNQLVSNFDWVEFA